MMTTLANERADKKNELPVLNIAVLINNELQFEIFSADDTSKQGDNKS
jgi:hypothetical protein